MYSKVYFTDAAKQTHKHQDFLQGPCTADLTGAYGESHRSLFYAGSTKDGLVGATWDYGTVVLAGDSCRIGVEGCKQWEGKLQSH